MKIISGLYKGRTIHGYNIEGTRPTQDRVKESLFGMIQSELRDKIVLDLFAGTGNLGLEALSNGSMACIFVDHNPKCTGCIQKTVESFQIPNAEIYTMDYKKALEKFQKENRKFDLIFLDPPYRYHNMGGIVVCEYEEDKLQDEYPFLQRLKTRNYGSKNISIYQYRR